MSYGNEEKLNKNLMVVISRQLARGRYEMTINERRLMYVAMSKIRPVDGEFRKIIFTKSEYIQLLKDVGIRVDSNEFDKELEESCIALLKRIVKIKDDKGWEAWQWMAKARYTYATQTVELQFHKEMEPFLLYLKENIGYSKFALRYALPLTSPYAVRFYERFRGMVSPEFPAKKEKMTPDEIREFLILGEKYQRYSHLKERVINQAVKEINQKTDLFVSFREDRGLGRGRGVNSLTFLVEIKPIEIPPDDRAYLAWDDDDLIEQIVSIIEQADQRRIVYNKRMLPNSEYAHAALAKLLSELKKGEHAFYKIHDLQNWLEKTILKYSNELNSRQISFDQLEAERKKTLDMAKEVFSSNDE